MKKHYDICVAGFWYGFNYGSLLNGYAEYKLLKNMGKEVLMLHKPIAPGAPIIDREITEGHKLVKCYDNGLYYSLKCMRQIKVQDLLCLILNMK